MAHHTGKINLHGGQLNVKVFSDGPARYETMICWPPPLSYPYQVLSYWGDKSEIEFKKYPSHRTRANNKKKFIWRFFPTEGTRVKLNLKSTLHTELGQIIKNLYGTIKDPESPKQSWEENKSRRHSALRLQLILQSYHNQNSGVLVQKQT